MSKKGSGFKVQGSKVLSFAFKATAGRAGFRCQANGSKLKAESSKLKGR
jgi:hypothetical protein